MYRHPSPHPSSDDEDILHIEIHRDGTGFGFSIRGGVEYIAPLHVLLMASGGAAEKDGRLRASTLPPSASVIMASPPCGCGLAGGG